MHAVGNLMDQFDLDINESGAGKPGPVLADGQCARHSAGPTATASPIRSRQVVLGDDVGHAHAPTSAQDSIDRREHGRLVHRQIDHAVGDDHVNGLGRQRDVLDVALHELYVEPFSS